MSTASAEGPVPSAELPTCEKPATEMVGFSVSLEKLPDAEDARVW